MNIGIIGSGNVADMKELASGRGQVRRRAAAGHAWPATKEVVQGLGDLTGKILIDATNPVLPDVSGLALGTTTSAGEQVAGWARGAKVLKAFNTVGANIMANPAIRPGKTRLVFLW